MEVGKEARDHASSAFSAEVILPPDHLRRLTPKVYSYCPLEITSFWHSVLSFPNLHMERQTWEDKLKLAQEVTSRATRLELAQDYAGAFESYVHAADLYIWLVKNRELQVEARELRERLRKVLTRAEAIKLSGRNIKIPERSSLSDGEPQVLIAYYL